MSNIILIPTYNERDNIADLISRIRDYEKTAKIMVIADNSPDGTAEVVKNLMKRDPKIMLLERVKKEGLGAAYIDALSNLRKTGDIENVITMDADGSHDPKYIPGMLGKMKDYDLVVGSRYVSGGGVENWEWHRRTRSRRGNI